jgi:aspartyl-tRNA(Asn)/glutamyl-tRNA(Gln) amidotransferase subunit C
MTDLNQTADPNEAAVAASHSAAVTLDDVRYVATLANLQLTADEEPRMQHDLNAILGHIAALSQLNTEGVEPMAQVGQLLQLAPALAGSSLRPDEIRPSVDRAAVMAEAPDTDGRFFKVPKVIER